MTQTSNPRSPDNLPLNPVHRKFGARVSTIVPTFEVGDATFETRVLVVGEDRQITTIQRSLPQAEKDEAGQDKDLTPEQQDATLVGMVDIMVKVLQPRFLSSENPELTKENITEAWMFDNLTSNDIGPLLYLLRKGTYQPEEPEDEGAESPNADQ
ncbi:hypothetical protein GCM10022631_01700 [Deinococcus rubellus]|uniref:Tail assembly chaperone n=1 Tax=Deinococcus rubellus TaxID=1889240 RepID=A0ABY5YII7_9DEIO|nr:hypothetical protein [Deinococcus rubellus]UWX64751.1 hypothetical protein N0D28_03570 [Deinococcus rubellus]